ncbi:FAD/NAD(P)-binding protein [Streptomyces sodiiphilus]|uniref:FAD/NAD(P)-binding protein n=1 Tax=Streptomyces sodiiphilus TaxID=226217 RepID=A0ABP5A5Y4_9ACTN
MTGTTRALRREICLVGAGPRGLSVLERLCAAEAAHPSAGALVVRLVDPSPPGPGRVWRVDQSLVLLMNTVSSQISLYPDSSVRLRGPLVRGPSLHEWARMLEDGRAELRGTGPATGPLLAQAAALQPDDYPSRALYGAYLTWVFRRIVESAPAHLEVVAHQARAVRLDDEGPAGEDGGQRLLLDDGTVLPGLSAVVLAQGHTALLPSAEERALDAFARRNGLRYFAPANPADLDLDAIPPGGQVIVRGLGLTFFDHLALLTVGRGGSFERSGRRLVYRPSGREPLLYAGSRRGVPYHARGENQKGAFGRIVPRVLTPERIEALRARSRAGKWVRFDTDIWPLISKEVRAVYYEALLAGRTGARGGEAFAERFLAAGSEADENAVLDASGVRQEEHWDWQRISRPTRDRNFRNSGEYREWLLEYLREDVRQAALGNLHGPLKAALDTLRDLRNEVRLLVDHCGLEGDSHRDDLYGRFTPLNAFLSIGPPSSRVEELIALIEAGVVEVAGPGLQVRPDETAGAFTARSAEVNGPPVRATTLIEARLHETDLHGTADPLMRHLLETGQCTAHRVPREDGTDLETGGLAVTRVPYRVIGQDGRAHRRRFAFGVPTESVHWVTAAGIRPGVGSVTLEDADTIAATVLALPPVRLPEIPPARRPVAEAVV